MNKSWSYREVVIGISLLLVGNVMASELDIARSEFAKFYEQACGRKPGADLLALSVDPKVSKQGNDAYVIRSTAKGVSVVGSNGRSCLYGVYDLLERRAGCRWFWDGDRVPRTDRIDLSGLDVREESRFEFRGLRYFAHRGLTRFQAEHWGLEDWKREIDWCLKSRLNVMMLRIGQDDLFQKAFPGVVDYPDPAKPLPEAMKGYDNRSLFWSLQYRGKLRKALQQYAFDRGMMIPEDFGTMSHWYSRTPYQFLNRMKPDFYPQQGGCYGHVTDRIWDVRNPKWLNAYWKLTEASIANYGKPDLLHTIGMGERRCHTNRADNVALKERAIAVTSKLALSHYPDSRILLAGWDFWDKWYPEEIRALLPKLDPKKMIVWDYEADAARNWSPTTQKGNDFTQWGLIGHFPYTFGIFEAFESALDPRADYALIEERQRLIDNDPYCRGYIFWPESSHTDSFMLRFFPANAWRPGGKTFDTLIGDFCRDRYGREAARMERLWRTIQPMCRQLGWGGNCTQDILHPYGTILWFNEETNGEGNADLEEKRARFGKEFPYATARRCFAELAEVDVSDPQVRRDAIDLARMLIDRRIIALKCRLIALWCDYLKGAEVADELMDVAADFVRDGAALVGILGSHEDYSLYASFKRLDAIEKIQNPNFEHVLVDNASCWYCRSHHYEFAEHWYQPMICALAGDIVAKVRRGERQPIDQRALNKRSIELQEALLKAKLVELSTPVNTSPEVWRALMTRCAATFMIK